ncbi:MAG TPA: protein kinase [Kofleriaceae bacterium]
MPVERHHYAITRELARGGIGRVFEARDLRIGRQVAIKELLPKNRDAARRFEREARITARLQHPAIIHVYEAGVWPGGEPFYAMPLVSGRSLDAVVAERKTLNERLGLLPNVIAVADALAYAHNANVIHRDLKPANVLVGEFGETVVIDWGLAKDLGVYTDPKESMQMRMRATADETMSGSVVGTPAYMPPEQARGDAVDQRADVYALGGLLYKLLAGCAPYTGKTSLEVVEQVKSGPPIPVQDREPDAPPDLVAIVTKAMARNPNERYVTASELAQDLKRFETGQLVGAHRYTTGELLRRWLSRHRVAVSIGAAATIALLVVGVLSLQRIFDERQKATEARDLAKSERDKAIAGRINLLEERGRTHLLDKNAANALAYLIGAAEADGDKTGGARGFMIADAMAPFAAEIKRIEVGRGDVVVVASPTGKLIATAGNGPIQVSTPEGVALHSFGTHGVTRVIAFDATGSRIVAAGDDGIARIWSTTNYASIADLRGHIGAINDAVFSADGKLLATAGVDASVRIWDVATKVSHVVVCHGKPVVSVRFSPSGAKLLSASADTSACVFTHNDNSPNPWTIERQIRGHTAALNSAEWSADGRFIVTASDDETARVWSEVRGKPVYRGALHHDPGTVVQRALITSDGSIITVGSDLAVRIWELPSTVPEDGATPQPIKPARKLVGHSGRIIAAALSADERYLATGGFDGLAKIWDLQSRQEVATFEPGEIVTSVAFVPGTTRLVTGSRDGTARIWNTKVAERSLDLGFSIHAIAVGPDGAVAAGLADSLVRIVRGHDEPLDLHGHLGSVEAVTFTRGGMLISAGEDAAAIVWDPRTGRQLGTFAATTQDPPPPIQALATLPDPDQIALVRDGKVEVWSGFLSVVADKPGNGTLVRKLAAQAGRIDTLAIHPTSGAIVGVGHDGTFAIWNASFVPISTSPDLDSHYNAIAFAPDGSALVMAGPGFALVRKVIGGVVGKVDVTLESSVGIGVVRSVLITPDGSRVITAGDTGRAMIWDRKKGKLLGMRDRHDAAINALALQNETLWVASDDHMLSAWNVRVETGKVSELEKFMADKHVPVELQDDVVIRVRR